jgi:hypothetical protein
MVNVARRFRDVRGTNYVPSSAVNDCQFWEEYDEPTIERELGFAEHMGLNSVRVFLQYLVFEADPVVTLAKFDSFCSAAERHGMSVLPVLFDDCFGPEPALAPYPPPLEGIHNSLWCSSPGRRRMSLAYRPFLRKYVESYVRTFRADARVIAWEIYNEPSSEPPTVALMQDAFEWARRIAPTQPLTACWAGTFLSDVVNVHLYRSPSKEPEEVGRILESASSLSRPVLVTEFLGRPDRGTFAETLPLLAEREFGWYFWELMIGKTQVHLPWVGDEATHPTGVAYQGVLYPDGRPYAQEEIDLIRTYTAQT